MSETKVRRWKRFLLDGDLVIDLFRCMSKGSCRFTLPEIDGDMPPDARIVNVYGDHSRCGVCVTIESNSFDPVEAGTVIPLVEAEHGGTIFDLRKHRMDSSCATEAGSLFR